MSIVSVIVFVLCFWKFQIGLLLSLVVAAVTWPLMLVGVALPLGYVLGKRSARRYKERLAGGLPRATIIGWLRSRLIGLEWRLYFVRKGVGLEYALHNKDGFALLGYLQAKFCDGGERISDDWKLFLSYYTGRREEHFQLTEAMFTDASQFGSLIAKCRALDKNFDDGAAIGWNPTFRHVPTRKQLPLGGPTDTDFEDMTAYIERQLEQSASDEIDFSTISNEVFVRP